MKTSFIVFLFTLIAYHSVADTTKYALSKFKELQANSQTYKDYKVIRITSINQWLQQAEKEWYEQKRLLASSSLENQNLKKANELLNHESQIILATVKSQEEVQKYLTLFGLNLHRNTFLLITLGSLAILSIISCVLWGKLKLVQLQLTGKRQELLGLHAEFENLKHRALEKQMKLSRELQNERNKLEQLKSEKRQMV